MFIAKNYFEYNHSLSWKQRKILLWLLHVPRFPAWIVCFVSKYTQLCGLSLLFWILQASWVRVPFLEQAVSTLVRRHHQVLCSLIWMFLVIHMLYWWVSLFEATYRVDWFFQPSFVRIFEYFFTNLREHCKASSNFGNFILLRKFLNLWCSGGFSFGKMVFSVS